MGISKSMSTKFVKFPKSWQVCLAELHADGSVYRVALYLLDRASFSEYVRLGNRVLEKQGVSRASKWRALRKLRHAGLIAVDDHKGRVPRVRVRWTR
jgi:hypothetical protein